MKSRWKLISMKLITECLNNRSMNLQLRPSPNICHGTGMEEGPKVTLDIQCLRQGVRVALTLMNNYFLHQRGSGSTRAMTV